MRFAYGTCPFERLASRRFFTDALAVRQRRPPTRFRWARAWAGLTQAELAAAVGASRETISSIERERSIPSVALAILIAHRLERDVDALFEIET